MSYQALARKWRPKKFSEVLGQGHIVSALTHALKSQRIHHGFLFTGTRGVGKTTLARIFAKALNCSAGIAVEPCGECTACRGIDEGSFIDLIEVDAASRTKVDDTRELLDNVQYSPSMGRFKIYLIDEVHMLSTHSFNALLKTLEEPPEHVKFLLATTDPQKLPATILSRCIQFNLKSMSTGQLTEQLEKILKLEGLEYELSALQLLSRSGDGSVRDSLSLLDQAIAYSNGAVTRDHVREMLGMIDNSIVSDLLQNILDNDAESSFARISRLTERALDYGAALDDLLLLIHNVALYQAMPDAARWKDIEIDEISPLADCSDPETLQLLYQIGLAGKRDLDYAPDSHSGFEMIVLRMLAFKPVAKASPSTGGSSSRGQGQSSRARRSQSTEATDQPSTRQPAPSETSGEIKNTADPIKAMDESETATQGPKTAKSQDRENKPKSQRHIWSNLDLKELLDQPKWEALINDLQADGMIREMLRHMVPQSVAGNAVEVGIRTGNAYFSESRLRQVEEACWTKLNLPIQLRVCSDVKSENGNDEQESIAQREQREEKEQLKQAQKDFQNDPLVQELVMTFDGSIDRSSIVLNSNR